ncbi:MAG: hypothetical protein RL018_204, partial [Pseudomonadota bacterium]
SDGGNNNLGAVNSAIALLSEDATNTTAKVQNVVDAFKAVLTSADKTDNNATNPTQAQYATLGVKGVDTTAAEKLLGDVIDIKSNDDVNSVDRVQKLADEVAAVLKTVKGDTSALVTEAQLKDLGITQVDSDNIKAIQAAIGRTNADGSDVDTLSDLQGIVNAIVASQARIQNFDATTASADVPTSMDYSNIGVTGVTVGATGNLSAINSSILYLGESNTNTSAKVQNVVDAYKAILDNANGKDNSKDNNPAFTPPTAKQYTDIGISFSGLKDEQVKARVALLGSAIDVKSMGGVDTLDEVKNLADTVDKLMKHAADTSQTFTLNELTNLGIKGLTDKNMVGMLAKVFASDNGGTGIDTLSELQLMVDTKAPEFKASASGQYTVNPEGRFVTHMNENDFKFVFPILTDADANNKYTFTLSTDDGRFFKFTDHSEVVFIDTPNYEDAKDGEKNNSYHFEITAEDSAGNITKQLYSVFVDNVRDADEGDKDLGTLDGKSLGKLIAGKTVGGRLYYFWDKNGDGIANIEDATTMDDLAKIFRYDAAGKINTNNGADQVGYITDNYRFATLNGMKLALPTFGAIPIQNGQYNITGSNYDLRDPNSQNTSYSKFDGLYQIWDAFNGNKTSAYVSSNPIMSAQNGTPDGWMKGTYWSSKDIILTHQTSSQNQNNGWDPGHFFVDLSTGEFGTNFDNYGVGTALGSSTNIYYAAFQLL